MRFDIAHSQMVYAQALWWEFPLLPKYFFQVAGGNHVLDVEGRELHDASVARREGIKFAGEILKDMPTVLYETASLKIDVTDESGQVLFKVLVTTLGDDEIQSASTSERPLIPSAPLGRN